MSDTNRALNPSPPKEIYVRNVVATEEEFELPSEFIGQFITLQAQGEDVYYRIFVGTKGADSGEAISIAAGDATISSQVISPHAQGATHLPNGDRHDWDLSKLPYFNKELSAIKVLHISSAATAGAHLRFWRSSGPVS